MILSYILGLMSTSFDFIVDAIASGNEIISGSSWGSEFWLGLEVSETSRLSLSVMSGTGGSPANPPYRMS